MIRLKNPGLLRQERFRTLRVFLLAALLGVILILPFMIYERGYFFYYGDFNVQQVPFLRLCVETVHNGEFGWSWLTDLGSDFIGSYSFYTLGSPFFWLMLLFPSSWTPALIGPMMILKMSVAALGAYLYMRRYIRDYDYAVIGALLYAFSSFTIYNIFFNHFIDVVALFPFLMYAFDELVEKDRWGLFALLTALNLFNNYFFFFGEVLFVLIYYVLRVTAPDDWDFRLKNFLHIVLEAVIGVGTTAFMMIPSYLLLADNPRLSGVFNGWGFFIYDKTRRYLDVFQSLLFPPELPHYDYFIADGNTRWQSVAAWLPLFSLAMVIAFLVAKKSRGTWQKRILIYSFVALLIPGLGSLFYLMKANYYSRWLYMPVLIMAMVSVRMLEDRDGDESRRLGFKWNAVFTLMLFVPIALIPVLSGDKVTVGLYSASFGGVSWGGTVLFFVCGAIALLSALGFWLLYRFFYHKDPERYKQFLKLATCACICVYGLFILIGGKVSSQSTEELLDNSLDVTETFEIPGESGDGFYRIDVVDGMDNQGLYWNVPSINFFHSTVSPSIMEFYKAINVERNVGSRPGVDKLGLRSLTSVKYIFQKTGKSTAASLPNLTLIGQQYGYDIYLNGNYIPFGFAYDRCIAQTVLDSSGVSKLDQVMLYAIVLNNEQLNKYSNRLEYVSSATECDFSMDAVSRYSTEHRAEACYNFSRDKKGFSAEIDLSGDKLVFFSLPYSKGWTATVNGKPVTVEKVNYGLTAIPVGAGHSEIRFDYETPGLAAGLKISAVFIVLLAGLFVVGAIVRRKKPAFTAQSPALRGWGPTVLAETAEPEAETTETEVSETETPETAAEEPAVTELPEEPEDVGTAQEPQQPSEEE